eukprot:1158755-Pelagomonas_calceolata.AAC.3
MDLSSFGAIPSTICLQHSTEHPHTGFLGKTFVAHLQLSFWPPIPGCTPESRSIPTESFLLLLCFLMCMAHQSNITKSGWKEDSYVGRESSLSVVARGSGGLHYGSTCSDTRI